MGFVAAESRHTSITPWILNLHLVFPAIKRNCQECGGEIASSCPIWNVLKCEQLWDSIHCVSNSKSFHFARLFEISFCLFVLFRTWAITHCTQRGFFDCKEELCSLVSLSLPPAVMLPIYYQSYMLSSPVVMELVLTINLTKPMPLSHISLSQNWHWCCSGEKHTFLVALPATLGKRWLAPSSLIC